LLLDITFLKRNQTAKPPIISGKLMNPNFPLSRLRTIGVKNFPNERNYFPKEDFKLLKISDNGLGKVVDEKAKGTGFGTQLVDLLTRQIDAGCQ